MADEKTSILIIKKLSLIGVLVIAIITIAAIVFSLLNIQRWGWEIALAITFTILLLGTIALGSILTVRALIANWGSSEHVVGHITRIEAILANQGQDIQSLAGMASLSDQAKSLIYYEKEVDALHESVNAMILKQDYESAEALISRMEARMGMADEVAKLRREVENTRQATEEEKIETAIERIDSILKLFHWAQAKREADRLISLFPSSPQIMALPKRISAAHNARKRELLKEYSDACRVNDVERSIELLKALDKYLTPQEGSALAESARDVFKKKLHNLGVQFTIAVEDQQWSKAITTGEEIIREFPNSRMSREVQEKLEQLRAYATNASVQHTPPPPPQPIPGKKQTPEA